MPMPQAPHPDGPDAELGAAVCRALRDQAGRLGLDLGREPVWEEATFRPRTDPYSCETSQVGTWQGGARYGTVTFFADGRVFAEYQVLQPHPAQPGCWVEAVQVWGRPPAWRGDAVLLQYPE